MTWGTATRKRPNAEKLEIELGLMRHRNNLRHLIWEENEAGHVDAVFVLKAELDAEMAEDRECYPQLYRKKPKRKQWVPRVSAG